MRPTPTHPGLWVLRVLGPWSLYGGPLSSGTHSFSGRSPVSTPDLPIKLGVALVYSSEAAFARSDTPRPLSPGSLFPRFFPKRSWAPVPGLAAAASFLHPLPTLPAAAAGQRDIKGLRMPRFLRMALEKLERL